MWIQIQPSIPKELVAMMIISMCEENIVSLLTMELLIATKGTSCIAAIQRDWPG
jgi:hypothetical protein